MITHVLFVNSAQPRIDRGWPSHDCQQTTAEMGLKVIEAFVETDDELKRLVEGRSDVLVWPLCYTIGADVNGKLLTALLSELGLPFVGATASDVILSSKLLFKEAVTTKTPYRTPRYQILEPRLHVIDPLIGFPTMIKAEYSCNSEGVSVARNLTELFDLSFRLAQMTGQRVFVEKWERHREFTVAYLPGNHSHPPLAAALELKLIDNRCFIDSEAKHNNELISFSRPETDLSAMLERATIHIADRLGIDGHFRLDFIANAEKEVFVIEANFLPHLTRSATTRSYYPMAFEMALRLSYSTLIGRILAHAVERHTGNASAGLSPGGVQ